MFSSTDKICATAILEVPSYNRGIGSVQWRTFVEISGGDESLQHQLKRQDRVNLLSSIYHYRYLAFSDNFFVCQKKDF